MKKLLNAALLVIVALSWATPAFAQEGHEQPGQVVFGNDRRLEAGDIINGDMVIFGGSLSMADGSRIQGDAVVFGGRGEINGEIEGDLAIIAGSAKLGPTARVNGDVAAIGGEVDLDQEAFVGGDIIETTRFDFGQIPLPPLRTVPPRLGFERSLNYEPAGQLFRMVLAFVRGLVAAVVISAIGLLVVLFMPEHTQTVGQTIRRAAPTSFGVGLLTLIVGITLMTLLFITCCLIPVGFLLALGLVLATLFGWIVVGYLLGGRVLGAIQGDSEPPTPVASTLVGIFIITLVQQGAMALSHIPCVGFFFWLLGAGLWLLIASTGLGAVVLTRFGTQVYTGAPPRSVPPPPLPPDPSSGPSQFESPDLTEPELADDQDIATPHSESEATDPADAGGSPADDASSDTEG